MGLGSGHALEGPGHRSWEPKLRKGWDQGPILAWLAVNPVYIGSAHQADATLGQRDRLETGIHALGGGDVRNGSHKRRACSSPVRAARSQEVLVGMKFHHIDRSRVARELGHHLARGEIPELGRAG